MGEEMIEVGPEAGQYERLTETRRCHPPRDPLAARPFAKDDEAERRVAAENAGGGVREHLKALFRAEPARGTHHARRRRSEEAAQLGLVRRLRGGKAVDVDGVRDN